MARPPRSPTVRARALGARLEELRNVQGMSPEDVAASVDGMSRWKVRRLETAKTVAQERDIQALLDLYGVDTATRAALLQLTRDAWRRGWWTDFGDVFRGAYVALEDEASAIRVWHPQLVPGLLQITDYAREVFRAGLPEADEETIERHVQARMARQALLSRRNAPGFHAVLDEAVLEHEIGGRVVMRRQLRALLEAVERSTVTVRVLTKTAGAHAGFEGPLVILSFSGDLPDTAYCEAFPGSVYLESAADIARSNLAMERIHKAALSGEESAALIARLCE